MKFGRPHGDPHGAREHMVCMKGQCPGPDASGGWGLGGDGSSAAWPCSLGIGPPSREDKPDPPAGQNVSSVERPGRSGDPDPQGHAQHGAPAQPGSECSSRMTCVRSHWAQGLEAVALQCPAAPNSGAIFFGQVHKKQVDLVSAS